MVDQSNDGDGSLIGPGSSATSRALRALKEQTTPRLWQAARRYAQFRATMVSRAGRPVSKTYARELVHDAHADTWSGDLPWNPEQCTLLSHLRRAIKKRTWKEIQRASREAVYEPRPETMPELEEALARASNDETNPTLLGALVATTCWELRRLAADDDEAARLVQAWEQGATVRSEVMARTNLGLEAYERAKRRVIYISRELPSDLREAAQDLLRARLT